MCTAYLPGDYSPYPNLAVARVSITYALSRTSLREQGISHLSLQQVTRVHPLSLVARVFRCAAASYGCACTATALDNHSGTSPGLGCGVDPSGRRLCVLVHCGFRCYRRWLSLSLLRSLALHFWMPYCWLDALPVFVACGGRGGRRSFGRWVYTLDGRVDWSSASVHSLCHAALSK